MVVPQLETMVIRQADYPNPMKVVILAGGKGTRIMEMSGSMPKPLMMVGDKPLLRHIIDIYEQYGLNDFVIAGGYKVEMIAAYLSHFQMSSYVNSVSPLSWSFDGGGIQICVEDTGLETSTGGRLKRLSRFLKDSIFMVTYGDGLSDVDINKLLSFHNNSGRLATVTAVHPKPRFGAMNIDRRGQVLSFSEKKDHMEGWINGGFFVFHPDVLSMIEGDNTSLEYDVLPRLVELGQMVAYLHEGFWECVDTLRDLNYLNEYYEKEGPTWISGKTVR